MEREYHRSFPEVQFDKLQLDDAIPHLSEKSLVQVYFPAQYIEGLILLEILLASLYMIIYDIFGSLGQCYIVARYHSCETSCSILMCGQIFNTNLIE